VDLHVGPVIVAQGAALAVGAALLAGIYPPAGRPEFAGRGPPQ
jgi:hypothetical protein